MKNFTILFTFTVLTALLAHGQIEKGSKLIGASIGSSNLFLNEGSGVRLQLNPTVGVMISKNWMVGAGVTLGAIVSDGFTGVAGLSPFARYYFNGKRSADSLYKGFFLLGGVGVVATFGNEETSLLQGAIGGGYCRFITPDVGLELSASLQNTVFFDGIGDPNLNLNFSLGLQIILNNQVHLFKRKAR